MNNLERIAIQSAQREAELAMRERGEQVTIRVVVVPAERPKLSTPIEMTEYDALIGVDERGFGIFERRTVKVRHIDG